MTLSHPRMLKKIPHKFDVIYGLPTSAVSNFSPYIKTVI